MKIPRVYIDTSVIGGCFDNEFAYWSNLLVDNLRLGYFKPVVSSIVAKEISGAPAIVIQKYNEIVEYDAELLIVTNESLDLKKCYQQRKIINDKFENDMQHIALATIENVDILVSWNFTHIVRYNKISQFNAVNIDQGYKPLAIYSPREVVYEKKV